MIFWTGWGILAGVVGLIFVQLGIDAICGPGYYTGHAWPKILGCAVSAPVIWLVGRSMNAIPDSEEPYSEQPTRPPHTLFFVPMQYWGIIFIVIGVLIAAKELKEGKPAI